MVHPNWRVEDLSNDKGVEKLGGGCRNLVLDLFVFYNGFDSLKSNDLSNNFFRKGLFWSFLKMSKKLKLDDKKITL